MDRVRDKSNVADTCMACLAFLRAESTPAAGDFAGPMKRGVAFICSEVERADGPSLWVTRVRGTRLQSKIGTYIDTFLAALLLAEVKNCMGSEEEEVRVDAALRKVLGKIEKHQRGDGTWDNKGWAPALGQRLAGKALNKAAQKGGVVSDAARRRVEEDAMGRYNAKASGGYGAFAGRGSAGVDLYGAAAAVGNLKDSNETNEPLEKAARERLKTATTEREAQSARAEIARYASARKALKDATATLARRVEDPRFVSGFGSNGGEEFLSYLSISEALVSGGGEAWAKWDAKVTANLQRVQNKDGSWTGHHCITGRTFCTSAALLVLLVDRATISISKKMGGR
jgi:hypothetical protein